MTKWRLFVGLLVLGALLTSLACGGPATSPKDKILVYKIKMHFLTLHH